MILMWNLHVIVVNSLSRFSLSFSHNYFVFTWFFSIRFIYFHIIFFFFSCNYFSRLFLMWFHWFFPNIINLITLHYSTVLLVHIYICVWSCLMNVCTVDVWIWASSQTFQCLVYSVYVCKMINKWLYTWYTIHIMSYVFTWARMCYFRA